jgi:hypothetical protein
MPQRQPGLRQINIAETNRRCLAELPSTTRASRGDGHVSVGPGASGLAPTCQRIGTLGLLYETDLDVVQLLVWCDRLFPRGEDPDQQGGCSADQPGGPQDKGVAAQGRLAGR